MCANDEKPAALKAATRSTVRRLRVVERGVPDLERWVDKAVFLAEGRPLSDHAGKRPVSGADEVQRLQPLRTEEKRSCAHLRFCQPRPENEESPALAGAS